MIIRKLEELRVYQKALTAADAVSAIIARPSFEKDRRLREQLSASSSRVPALIAEGFEQKTDKHFAHYLYLARGSAKESKTHLIVAVKRRHVSQTECDDLSRDYDEISSMSSGLIQHLEREDRPHRQFGREPRERPITDDDCSADDRRTDD
jgi:four helix bundle protein